MKSFSLIFVGGLVFLAGNLFAQSLSNEIAKQEVKIAYTCWQESTAYVPYLQLVIASNPATIKNVYSLPGKTFEECLELAKKANASLKTDAD